MRKAFSKLLVLSGSLIIIISLLFLWRRNDPGRLQFNPSDFPTSHISSDLAEPTGIAIEGIQVRLPIIHAGKIGNEWETTTEGVSYLTLSPKPGERGNSILYGHNWGSVLGNLYKVQPGQTIEIYYSDGSTREFEVGYVQEVLPSDTSILQESQDPRITLYTCSGLLDEKRLVVTAFLTESLGGPSLLSTQ